MQAKVSILQKARWVSPSVATDAALRKTTSILPARHGPWAHTHPFRNLELRAILTAEFDYCSVPFIACLAATLVPGFDESQLSGGLRDRRLRQLRAGFDLQLLQRVLNRFREIAHQVTPVGDLHSRRGTLLCSFSIKATAIPSDDLHSRVLAKPVSKTWS